MTIKNELEFDPFDRPIPGESLTNDPQDRKPWERPPKYTDINVALQEFFLEITEEPVYGDLMDHIREGIPLTTLVQVLLFKGYMRGDWTTDLMLLMAEPAIYMLGGLAEQNGIYEYLIYDGEDTDLDEEEAVQLLEDDMKRMRPKKLNTAVKEQMANALPDSLLASIQSAQPAESKSLLMGEE